jgi:hypothetical protein
MRCKAGHGRCFEEESKTYRVRSYVLRYYWKSQRKVNKSLIVANFVVLTLAPLWTYIAIYLLK